MRFQNRVVLVLGGNSGIGLAASVAFAQEGARVVITGVDLLVDGGIVSF